MEFYWRLVLLFGFLPVICSAGYARSSNFQGWAPWASWSQCSSTSGYGVQTRHRTCHSSSACPVGGNESKICMTAVHGGWSSWTTYSCSQSCGGGSAFRLRSCTNPVPLLGGSHCRGQSYEFVACNTHPCHGSYAGWASWTYWSHCSTTSGIGIQTRHRNCISTHACPVGGDESKPCIIAVHGGWSSWTADSCTKSCGGGHALRLRSCTNPVPLFGGSDCRGHSYEFAACNTHPCHVPTTSTILPTTTTITPSTSPSTTTTTTPTTTNPTTKQSPTTSTTPPTTTTTPQTTTPPTTTTTPLTTTTTPPSTTTTPPTTTTTQPTTTKPQLTTTKSTPTTTKRRFFTIRALLT